MRQYGIKGLAALGMLLVMLGMPSGSAKSEPTPLKANHVAAVYEAKKVRPLFQQLAVFPDGTQQPLAGGLFIDSTVQAVAAIEQQMVIGGQLGIH
ncbi:hypothetical protein FC12_GL001267 [Lacticaseibacillus paracasei subsp. tolerans DSM 20258]|nr:hypothetical protein FC12_GL001267 [Lacticaseibacillus paracasei subsp. tolerans DSM 20258]GEL37948.1 hypothetical protein LPA06_07990 [Lacticaseibacillus paracasei subsp. tolerans]